MTQDTNQKYVILDTDMGTDDAWALMMLIKAEKILKNIKILAITCVHGNTQIENVVKNTYRILHGLNRTDIPIYKGAIDALIPGALFPDFPKFHGENGMGDVCVWDPEIYPNDISELIQPENAVQAIYDLVLKYPKQITLIGIAPLTNIALALKTYPEIAENIFEIFLMGGNYQGIGNTSACAEFNFYIDPESAHIVLNSAKCPITVLPWESCMEENIKIAKEWRFSELAAVDCKSIQLLNEAEKVCYQDYDTFIPCDAFLTAVFLFPECIKKKSQHNVTIELSGTYTRGQMILDHLKKNNVNATVIELLDETECKRILRWTALS